MDTMVLVRLENELQHIDVEDILWVEIPKDSDRCYVEVSKKGWGRMDKSEVWKIERYKIDIFEYGDNETFRTRDANRLPDASWKRLFKALFS